MNIAIIGYGRMGQAIERAARARGHAVTAIIDVHNQEIFDSEAFRSADIAIEFTVPATAVDNYLRCFEAHIPVVSGTTGWQARMGEVREWCEQRGATLFYASNFSIGVNIHFALNRYLARLMSPYADYDVRIRETHHVHKQDAPSGTAITLAGDLLAIHPRKTHWQLADGEGAVPAADTLVIEARREGEVPGYHEVVYSSPVDTLTISHNANSREGFVQGALLAAEFTHKGKRCGLLGMSDLLPL
jgi:4-hydroxy-tetrahydrodipicolinate reductase